MDTNAALHIPRIQIIPLKESGLLGQTYVVVKKIKVDWHYFPKSFKHQSDTDGRSVWMQLN